MPLFRVLCRVDAFVDYVATVRAKDANEAAERAHDNAGSYKWEPQGAQEFDARVYVTLDPEGCEIEGTQYGDFL